MDKFNVVPPCCPGRHSKGAEMRMILTHTYHNIRPEMARVRVICVLGQRCPGNAEDPKPLWIKMAARAPWRLGH